MLPESLSFESSESDHADEISPLGSLHFGAAHSSESPKAYELKLRRQASELIACSTPLSESKIIK